MPTQIDQVIIFADIAGSSRLFNEIGNHAASKQINLTLTALSKIACALGGTLVKSIGDEIMLRFQTTDNASIAMREMQRYLSNEATVLKLKIGASFGPVVAVADDVFGEAVNDAACVARIAKANQIIITSDLYQALSQSQQSHCQVFDLTTLKGKKGRHTIYRMDWDNSLQRHCTEVMPALQITAENDTTPHIELEFEGKTIQLGVADLPFRFGRDRQHVDCFVPSTLASRQHCELLFRRKKFVLVDHSTNGTFIHQEHSNKVYLRREETPLQGQGKIIIGLSNEQSQGPVIHYQIQ